MEIIGTLIIGAIAGWLGSKLFKGSSLGLVGNIVIGVIGSFVGSFVLVSFSLPSSWRNGERFGCSMFRAALRVSIKNE